MEVIWQSEIDPYGCRVLKKHWPEVVNHGNIKEIKWGDLVRPDIICGGYPCQPFSTAGKRNGTDDPRHLWPWVRQAISELRPKYAILENVRGHITLGLSEVLGELASIGYDAEWQIVSANSVGAPHRRDRVIIVAYPNGGRQQECESETEQTPGVSFASKRLFTRDRWLNALMADTDNARNRTPNSRANTNGTQKIEGRNNEPQFRASRRSTNVANADSYRAQIPVAGIFASIKKSERITWWETEPDVGRVAHGVPSRVDRLRGLGNAVVPQVAELIGRMVIDYDTNL
jgi:DNA (cytosine-5)-methyltransferase 1